jgi:protein-L-isoaspartate(D-aspartate) O-methyltransferase
MPFALRRQRMIDDLAANKGITDKRVLQAMEEIPRHLFVEEGLRQHAYTDRSLPIGEKQTISKPYTVALMSSLLEVDGSHRVLEIGTGSGYQAAVLGKLCSHLYTIERIKPLYEQARENLKASRVLNVSLRWGDGSEGWPERAPFDRIILTAASPEPPLHLLSHLEEDGRLITPEKTENGQRLALYFPRRGGRSEMRDCGPCEFVPLVQDRGTSRKMR